MHSVRIACRLCALRAFHREKLGNFRAISNILAYIDHTTGGHLTQHARRGDYHQRGRFRMGEKSRLFRENAP